MEDFWDRLGLAFLVLLGVGGLVAVIGISIDNRAALRKQERIVQHCDDMCYQRYYRSQFIKGNCWCLTKDGYIPLTALQEKENAQHAQESSKKYPGEYLCQ